MLSAIRSNEVPIIRYRESPYPLLQVSEAIDIVISNASYLINDTKEITLQEAVKYQGYIISKDIISRENLPPFDAR